MPNVMLTPEKYSLNILNSKQVLPFNKIFHKTTIKSNISTIHENQKIEYIIATHYSNDIKIKFIQNRKAETN